MSDWKTVSIEHPMGVKSLSRYQNQYKAADEKSKDISKRLIREEEQLAVSVRDFL